MLIDVDLHRGVRVTAEPRAARAAVPISIGTAVYGLDGDTGEDLARAADAALYAAKARIEPRPRAAR